MAHTAEILENISDGFFALDKDWCFTYVNKRAAANLETTAGELIKQNIWEKFPQIIGTAHEMKYRKVMQSGQSAEYEGQGFLTERWYYTRVFPFENGISVCWHDITEYKKAEEELRKSNQRYRNLVEVTSDFIWETNQDGIYTYASPKIYDILGYKPREVIGKKTPFDLMPPEEAERVIKVFDELVSQQLPINSLENTNYHKDGHPVVLETNGVPVFDSAGNFQGYRGIDRDITERKHAEAALAKAKNELESRVQERTSQLSQSEDKFRRIIETANEGIWIVDLQSKILMANDQISETLGYPLEEILGRSINDFLIKDQERLIVAKMTKALNRGARFSHERRLRHKNGSTVYLLVNSSPLLDSEGQHIANIGMMSNITRRKKAEEALAQAKADLERANQQLKTYGQRITQVQEEERKRIAYELHDDTAQYISILKMQIGALIQSKKIRSPDILEKLSFLEKDADRAFHDVRRYSHELRPVVLEHMGLLAALEQIIEDINKLNNFKVELDVRGKEPELSEEVKLGFFRIAQESLNNIRKHAKAKNAIINLIFRKKHLSMMVIDNGVGFDVTQSGAKTDNHGSLGLMSMRERADLIEANLKIESKPGQGTIVRLEKSL